MEDHREIWHNLFLAVDEGRLERVRELISIFFGLSSSQDSRDGYVLICEALKNNHNEIAKLLLTNGYKVNCESNVPFDTPLHYAVTNGDIEIVEMLLDRGANIDAKCRNGTTPLYRAVKWKKMEIVKLLLNRDADVNAKEKYGISNLHIAADVGYVPIVQQLLRCGADVNSVCTYDDNERCSPLYLAVINEHETVVQLLLEHGANVDAQDQGGKTILYFAVKKGHSSIIKHLLKHSPDVNNTSAFHLALHGCENKYTKIVENMLQYGFPVNLDHGDNCKLHGAVEIGNLKIFEEELIKYGVNIDSKDKFGKTALHIACEWSKQEIVKVLLKFGADIDSEDNYGTTALHIASYNVDAEVVETLLKFGANIDIKNKYGHTALDIAFNNCVLQIIELLLKFGADINSKDGDGRTVLHIAARCRKPEHVEVLLKLGADIDSKDKYGTTALHIASERSYREVIEVLLKFGADINSEDKDGRTALHIVCTQMDKNLAKFLLDHGSDMTVISERNYRKIFAEIFKRHAVKVKTANLYVRNKIFQSISRGERLNKFRNECEKEVASMKSEKFGNANISFCDILTKDKSQLAIYAGNESIVQVFGSDDYKIKFPIYATLINSNFRKGERRKELVEQGHKFFYFFTNSLGIPYECTEKILNYLSNDDLRSIMDACKPISISSLNTDNK